MTTAIANALLASAWQGVAAAAALFAALRLIPHHRPRIRHAASLAALATMLCGFLLALFSGLATPAASVVVTAPGPRLGSSTQGSASPALSL